MLVQGDNDYWQECCLDEYAIVFGETADNKHIRLMFQDGLMDAYLIDEDLDESLQLVARIQ